MEAHYVGVVELAHDRDFALHVSDEAGSGEFLLVDDFHGHALPRLHVARVVDFGEGTAAEDAAQLVFSEQGGFLRRRRRLVDLRHCCATRDRTLTLKWGRKQSEAEIEGWVMRFG